MDNSILVRLKIPIPAIPIVGTPSMVFGRWAPLGAEDQICIEEDGAVLRLWFDRSCFNHVIEVGDVSNHINILIGKVFADVTLCNVSVNLKEHIRAAKANELPKNGTIAQEYQALGNKVLLHSVKYMNKLISYARVTKGQYWLHEYEYDTENMCQYNIHFHAKVQLESEWYGWNPSNTSLFRHIGHSDESKRYIQSSDWDEVKLFLTSRNSPSLVLELLAGAELLAGTGQRRNSLAEAITALEISIADFCRAPNAERLLKPEIQERLNISSLKDVSKRLGLTSSINYLFPILFTEEQLPTTILRTCQSAIIERQNIVHNGQRDVKPGKLMGYLSSIRQMCAILKGLQA
jgi:hypothetical protein